jgi:hypothetical protein
VIRSLTLYQLKNPADVEQVRRGVALAIAIDIPGLRNAVHGQDLGLREGNAAYGLSVDFDDETAYRTWDTNEEHLRVRHEVLRPVVASAIRVQFRIG